MDISIAIKPEPKRPGLLGIEKIMFCYWAFTLVIIYLLSGRIVDGASSMYIARALILGGTLSLFAIYKWRPCRLTFFLRIFFQLTLLSYWYPETYRICSCFTYLDPVFAQADEIIFNCQPSITMSKIFDSYWWCEAFNLGYYSYYPLIIVTAFYALFANYKRFERTSFVILCVFLMYYLIYMFLPVAGPQYYFQAIGIEMAENGIFHDIGDYFRLHTDMLPAPGEGGFFQELVHQAHEAERPTAAFPSSHVGVSTVLLFLAYKLNKRLMIGMLPFYILLCASTVYIQAHYAIDVIGGWVSAIIFYNLSLRIYEMNFFYRPKGFGPEHRVHQHHHHHHDGHPDE